MKTAQILNEYSIYAKWSRNGQIIKIPYDEIFWRRELAAKVIHGAKALERALKDANERAKIEYIAMAKGKRKSWDMERLFTLVQEQPYNFTYGEPHWRLRKLDPSELEKLAGTRKNEGIVAVYKKETINKFRCASPKCPSHKNIKDYCAEFVKDIPNGPLN